MSIEFPAEAQLAVAPKEIDPPLVAACTVVDRRVPLTWRIPVSSRSPRSLTKTRSLRESLIRSKGSWMADEVSMVEVVVAHRARTGAA